MFVDLFLIHSLGKMWGKKGSKSVLIGSLLSKTPLEKYDLYPPLFVDSKYNTCGPTHTPLWTCFCKALRNATAFKLSGRVIAESLLLIYNLTKILRSFCSIVAWNTVFPHPPSYHFIAFLKYLSTWREVCWACSLILVVQSTWCMHLHTFNLNEWYVHIINCPTSLAEQ